MELREEARFTHEALHELRDHTNVVSLFDYGRVEGSDGAQYFMALELLDGETLGRRMRTARRLPAHVIIDLGLQIARGLRAAHAQGIVHRDLKPGNVMLVDDDDGNDVVKIIDFGVGKIVRKDSASQPITQIGCFVGTPQFMAPEQFDSESSPASDVHALGTLLYLGLAGHLPFTGETLIEIIQGKLALPIRTVEGDIEVPAQLMALVTRMLAPRPEDRPIIGAVCHELGELTRLLPLGHVSSIRPVAHSVPSPAPARSSWGAPAIAMGVLLLAIGAASAVHLGRSVAQPVQPVAELPPAPVVSSALAPVLPVVASSPSSSSSPPSSSVRLVTSSAGASGSSERPPPILRASAPAPSALSTAQPHPLPSAPRASSLEIRVER